MVTTLDQIEGTCLSCGPENSITSHLEEYGGDYLEIGCYYGYLITKLAINFPDRTMIGIDPFISDGWTKETIGSRLSDIERVFIKNINGNSNIKHFRGTSREFYDLGNFECLQNVTCIYIDGSHHYADIVVDVDILEKIKNDRIKKVFFDDLHIKDVNLAIQYFKDKYRDRLVGDGIRNGPYAEFMLK
jgi:hypothetical protein